MSTIVILDGGFSTQLATHVGEKIDGDPLWTARFLATDPIAVFNTHLDFLRAGADIIQTNTYQASIDGFVKYLKITETQSLELIHKAVELAKEAVKVYEGEVKNNNEAVNRKPLIAGSCGPYGASLHDGSEYTGEYSSCVSKSFLKQWHRPRIEALINAGVDLLSLETIPCKIEAEALVELLKEYPNITAWLTFSCRTDGKSIVDGSDFRTVAKSCYESAHAGQLIAVGINCIAPSAVSSFFRDFNKNNHTVVPLIVYPNSGETYTVNDGWKKCGTVQPLENFIHEWLDIGVKFVGGCCRTYADDVRKISNRVREWKKNKSSAKVSSCCDEKKYI